MARSRGCKTTNPTGRELIVSLWVRRLCLTHRRTIQVRQANAGVMTMTAHEKTSIAYRPTRDESEETSRSSPMSGHFQIPSAGLKGVTKRHSAGKKKAAP